MSQRGMVVHRSLGYDGFVAPDQENKRLRTSGTTNSQRA
jgi:hypothetical protein